MGERDGTARSAELQGDLSLLRSDVARRLLASRIPARIAYFVAMDGTAAGRGDVVPLDGRRVGGAHLPGGATRSSPTGEASGAPGASGCGGHDRDWPPEVLTIRGRSEITEVDGIPAYRRLAAHCWTWPLSSSTVQTSPPRELAGSPRRRLALPSLAQWMSLYPGTPRGENLRSARVSLIG